MKLETLSLKTIINELDFLRKTVIIQGNVSKKRFVASILKEKIPDPRNVKERCQSFIRKKNTKWVKQSEIITYQIKILKTQTLLILNQLLQNTKTFRINYPRLYGRLTVFQVGSNCSLYNDTKKEKIF